MTQLRHAILCVIALLALQVGCSSTKYVTVRQVSQNPLSEMLSLGSSSGPKPSDRTQQYLRRYDLTAVSESDPKSALSQLHTTLKTDPSPEGCQAFAELSYIGGIKAQSNDPKAGARFVRCIGHTRLSLSVRSTVYTFSQSVRSASSALHANCITNRWKARCDWWQRRAHSGQV